MKTVVKLLCVAWCMGYGLSRNATAEPVAEAAAKVFQDRSDNCVRLKAFRKAEQQDFTLQTLGLCMAPEGIFVSSLSGIEFIDAGQQGRKAAKSELTRLAVCLPDGSEYDADVLLADPEVDVAVIRVRPLADGTQVKFAAAPVACKADPTILENVVAIGRLTSQFQWKSTAAIAEISSVIESPTRLSIASGETFGRGAGIYNLSGEMVGLVTQKQNQRVIIPAETIQKLIETATTKI